MSFLRKILKKTADKWRQIDEKSRKMHKIGIFVKYNLHISEISINFAADLYLNTEHAYVKAQKYHKKNTSKWQNNQK